MTRTLLTVLYVLGAVLPIVGFARLLWRTNKGLQAAREVADRIGSRSGRSYPDFVAPHEQKRRDLWFDIALVGSGLVLSAVASIWSLHLG